MALTRRGPAPLAAALMTALVVGACAGLVPATSPPTEGPSAAVSPTPYNRTPGPVLTPFPITPEPPTPGLPERRALDPRVWREAAPLAEPRSLHTATRLPD